MKFNPLAKAVAAAVALSCSDAGALHVSAKVGIAGYFKIEVLNTDANGVAIESSRRIAANWQKNLITNNGLDLLCGTNNTLNTYCQVGSGSATPANGDTALQSRIASSSTQQANSAGTNNSVSPYYGFVQRTYRFVAGVATGNISELGIGPASTGNLFSRALVLDGLGAPTTITLLSDEVLDVVYQLRCYAPSADVTGTLTLGTAGGSYDFTARPIGFNSTTSTLWNGNQTGDLYSLGGLQSNNFYTAETNSLSAQTATYQTGTTANGMSAAGTLATYTTGNFYRDLTLVVDLNYGNFGLGMGFLSMPMRNCAYQFTFNPRIPKDNTKKFTIVVRFSVERI